MNQKTASDIERRIRDVQRAYFKELPKNIDTIHDRWIAYLENEDDHTATSLFKEFYRLIHGLAGSAETFGLMQIGKTARLIENLILHDTMPDRADTGILEQVSVLIRYLREQENQQQRLELPSITESIDNTAYSDSKIVTVLAETIFIYDKDKLMAESLAASLKTRGCEARVFNSEQDLLTELLEHHPSTIILDVNNKQDSSVNTHFLNHIRQTNPSINIICTASLDDIETRLTVLRSGSEYFMKKPFQMKALMNILESSFNRSNEPEYRVLIIDDETILAKFYAQILASAGVEAKTLSSHTSMLDCIKSYKPDLILLDIVMDGVNGVELAAIIRQFPEHDIIPIIFMSAERNDLKKLEAVDRAGDFMRKPIWPDYLIATVISKCRHARKLYKAQLDLQLIIREQASQKLAMDQHCIISTTDANGNITYVNNLFCDVSKYNENELIGRNHSIIKSDEHNDDFFKSLWSTLSSGNIWHGEIKNRDKYGSHFWVESTIVPFLDSDGIPYRYIAVRTDITKIKNNEIEQVAAQKRLSEQNTSLSTLTREEKLFVEAKSNAYNKITALTAQTLNIDRASLWLFDDKQTSLSCESKFDTYEPACTQATSLAAEKIPLFLDILNQERIIVSEEVKKTSSTTELYKPYLYPLSISALMCAGIFIGRRCIGVIFCESRNDRRIWWPEDINYIGTIADYIALLQEQWQRQTVQHALQESEFRLKQSQSFANIGTIDIDTSSMRMFWSEKIESMLGYPEKTAATYDNFIHAIHPNDQQLISNMISDCIHNNMDIRHEFRVVWPDKSIHWLAANASIANYATHDTPHLLGVIRDITQSRQIQDELISARVRAEQANNAKSEFLSRMGHELRTPLNAIIGFSQLLEIGEEPLTNVQKDSVQEILNAGRHLLLLINEILDLSKIEAGKIELYNEEVELDSIITECTQLLSPLTKAKNISISIPTYSKSMTLTTDRTRFKQIIINLLSNAIKYNRIDGTIKISTESTTRNSLKIKIKDSGYGISQQHQNRIFQPFERVCDTKDSIEGTGIGLVITKRLTELMNGNIGYNSTRGKGSTFWIEFPTK